MAARRSSSTTARRSSTTAARRTAPPVPPTPKPRPGERLFVLSVPFQERGIASANGAIWDKATRQTIYLGRTLPAGLVPYASPDYSWERWTEDDQNGSIQPAQPGLRRFKPREHQVEAARKIAKSASLGYRGFIEADDVGVGKTLSVWCGMLLVARIRNLRNVLIVCPKSVVRHWRSTIASVSDGGMRICVINYDRAKNLLTVPAKAAAARTTRTKNKYIADSGASRVLWDAVIFDESHKIKNETAQRTRAAARIARYADAAATAPFVIWMSATLGQNPSELGYLTPLLAQLTKTPKSALADFGQWLADQGFHVQYNERFGKWDWCPIPEEATPAEIAVIERIRAQDIQRMYGILFASPDAPSIRRLPSDIAGWPDVQRILHPVELDAEGRALYNQAWTEFRSAMAMVQRGRNPKGGQAARTRFRQKVSLLRAPGSVDHVMDLLDNGHQVAVRVEYHETLDVIRDALTAQGVTVAEFSGRNEATREADRLAFQHGDCPVILFTVKEGISLHAGERLDDGTVASPATRTTIVHDPSYSGLDSIQIEGRTHRDGQKSNIYYPFAVNCVDEDIVKVLLGRIKTTKAMAGDDVTDLLVLEAVLDAGSAAAAGVALPDLDAAPLAGQGAPRAAASPPAAVLPTRRPAPTAVQQASARPVASRPTGGLPARPPVRLPAVASLAEGMAGGAVRMPSRPTFGAAEAAALRASMQRHG
jgi:superfamily II DNA or RNA helicase